MQKMALFLNFCILVTLGLLTSTTKGNAIATNDRNVCDGRLFVEDAIVIDVPHQTDCTYLEIETDDDHILAFTVVHGTFEQIQNVLAIRDGFDEMSPTLLLENQMVYEVSNKNLPLTIYTTRSMAKLQFKKVPTSPLQIKIEKAVTCPFNVGTETQCGRVVDEISCYCATFTKRNQASQKSFCSNNQMWLLTIETRTEEELVQVAWGKTTPFWTSLTDLSSEGRWIWESTNTYLYPGYANWGLAQPNQSDTEDCMYIGYSPDGAWRGYTCGNTFDAICEVHPNNTPSKSF